MKISSTKAWLIGVALLLLAQVVWFGLLATGMFSRTAGILMLSAPGAAGFITAYLAPKRKILLGVSLAFPGAMIVSMVNWAYEAAGHAVDFSGIRGLVDLSVLTFLQDLVLCLIGASVAWFTVRIGVSRSGHVE